MTTMASVTYLDLIRAAKNLQDPINNNEVRESEYARGQVELIADVLGRAGVPFTERTEEVAADLYTHYVVGISSDPPTRLRTFETEDEAAEFVQTLEGHQDGKYYIDGPEAS